MESEELYYPQIAAQAGAYRFEQGIEVEIYSAKQSYFDWAKIRFTGEYRPKIKLSRKDPAMISMGYNGTMEQVFSGYVSKEYDGGTYVNEVDLKDESLLLEETVADGTFLNTTPQEMLSFFLSQAGVTKKKLSAASFPVRKMLPIRKQNVIQAIQTVNAAWGLKLPFFFSEGTFYWGEKPQQSKVYTFEYGVNIIRLSRRGGVWELETVSVPFVRHSHKINIIHPKISGEQEVLKVVSTTNDSGFIRTYIYF